MASKIKKDKKFGVKAQLKTPTNPTFPGTPVRNMMDHATQIGAHGIGMYKGPSATGPAKGKKGC